MDDYDYDEDFEQDIVSEESSKKTSAIIKIGNSKQHGSVVTRKKSKYVCRLDDEVVRTTDCKKHLQTN